MPLSLADVLSAQTGGGPVYEGGPDANVTLGGVLSALGMGGPSWLDAARKQTGADIAAYQRGGVPELMADTGQTQELAGGFGGTTTGKGIRAYHGSPYDFEKFDISKIGTGEGAQAYGHGLYFAENPSVAEAYKRALTGINPNSLGSGKGQFGVNGVPMPTGISGHAALDTGGQMDLLLGVMKSNPESTMIPYLKKTIEDRIGSHYSMQAEGSAGDDMRAMAKYYMEHVKNATPEQVSSIAPGKMYEVNINADPGQFLNWDKPLADQAEQVRKFFESYKGAGPVYPDTPGQHLPGFLTKDLSSGNSYLPGGAERSQMMSEAGIPGIRYLDQGSRPQARNLAVSETKSPTGDPLFTVYGTPNPQYFRTRAEAEAHLQSIQPSTSNYVVFNPEIVDILKKYGLAGLTMGGVLTAAGQQPAPAQ